MTIRKLVIGAVAAFLLAGCSNDPYPPAGGKKTIYSVIGGDPPTLDPVQVADTLSGMIAAQIYDCLYEYHYLKRPYELRPSLAEAMPEVSGDGLTYTIRLKRGVRFQDDPCFPGGKGREAVAGDVVYAVKRLADMRNDSTGWWTMEGKIVGLDEFREESRWRKDAGELVDYSRPVAGLEAPDPYTLRIGLKEPYPQLKYILAMTYTAATAREAVEYYDKVFWKCARCGREVEGREKPAACPACGDASCKVDRINRDFVSHPVGTGPFRLKEWSRRWKIILERNPGYREEFYPAEGEPGDREANLLQAAGRRLPIVDEVYFTMVHEAQPAWHYFLQGYQESSGISKDNFNGVITPEKELSEEFKRKGVRLLKAPEAAVFYVGFNMLDPVLGKNKKLRQAMSLAFDTAWRIEHLSNGRDIEAHGPLPPGIFGYDPAFRNPYKRYDVEAAKRMLAEAGYPGGIGPDGKELTLTYDVGSEGPGGVQFAQVFVDDMAKIGIRVNIETSTWAEFLRKVEGGRTQVFHLGWILDYPDPENFLQLFYGPNKSPGPNHSNYDNPEYNKLYERMKAMDDTPERLGIIGKMADIVVEDAVWIPSTYSVEYILCHQWYKNVKPIDITGGYLKYKDVDVEPRERLRREWNRPNYLPAAALAGAVIFAGVVLSILKRRG